MPAEHYQQRQKPGTIELYRFLAGAPPGDEVLLRLKAKPKAKVRVVRRERNRVVEVVGEATEDADDRPIPPQRRAFHGVLVRDPKTLKILTPKQVAEKYQKAEEEKKAQWEQQQRREGGAKGLPGKRTIVIETGGEDDRTYAVKVEAGALKGSGVVRLRVLG